MRTLLILLTMMAGAGASWAQGLAIDFKFKGATAGVYKVIGMMGGQNYLLDSVVTAKPGMVHWERSKPASGGLYYLVFPDAATFVQFLLDKDQEFSLNASKDDLVGTMQTDGSLDNALFYENLRFEASFKKSLDSIDAALKALQPGNPNQAYLDHRRNTLLDSRKAHIEGFKKNHPDSFFTIFKMAGQNPDPKQPRLASGAIDSVRQLQMFRDEYWDNTNLADERLLRTPVVPNKLKTYITQLTPQVADSIIKYADRAIAMSRPCAECFKFVVNWIAIQYEKPTVMGGEAVLVHLVDKYFTEENAHWFSANPEELTKIRKKVNDMRPSLIGKTAQDIRCKDLNGAYRNLYELKGPASILYMYSTSCSHCKERTPVLRDLQAQWKALGLEVYALCLDQDEVKWKEFVAANRMEGFINVIDPKYESQYYKKYHIDITPELYVMDADHKIIAKDLHPNQLDPVLKKAFGVK